MNRRKFLINCSLTASGLVLTNRISSYDQDFLEDKDGFKEGELYQIFKNPDVNYRPYVRWWWNGDKVNKAELARKSRTLGRARFAEWLEQAADVERRLG